MSRTTDIGLVMVKESFTLSHHVQDVDQQDEVQSDVRRCSIPSWWLSDWKGFKFHSRRWCFGQFGFALARQGRSKMMHGDGVGPPFSKRGGVREGQEMNMYLWTQLDEMLPPGRSNLDWGQAQLFMDWMDTSDDAIIMLQPFYLFMLVCGGGWTWLSSVCSLVLCWLVYLYWMIQLAWALCWCSPMFTWLAHSFMVGSLHVQLMWWCYVCIRSQLMVALPLIWSAPLSGFLVWTLGIIG